MTSDTAKAPDSQYNRMQWAGEEYLFEEATAAAAGKICGNQQLRPGSKGKKTEIR